MSLCCCVLSCGLLIVSCSFLFWFVLCRAVVDVVVRCLVVVGCSLMLSVGACCVSVVVCWLLFVCLLVDNCCCLMCGGYCMLLCVYW